MSELSDLLRTRLHERWDGKISYRDLAALSASSALGPISHQVVAKYLKGQHSGRIDEHVIQGLAAAFDLPVQRVRKAAHVPLGAGRPYQPPPEADRMGRPARELIDDLIRMLARVPDDALPPDGRSGPVRRARRTQPASEVPPDSGSRPRGGSRRR